MAKVNLRSKNLWKKILSTVLAIGLAFGAVVGITTLVSKIEEDPLKTIIPKFQVGDIASDGTFSKNSQKSIYSDLFECRGLKITPDFESNITFQVYFYDQDEKFLSMSASPQSDFYDGNDLMATYARIKIMPIEDAKIYWYEIFKYQNQLKIEVNKDQDSVFVKEGVYFNDVPVSYALDSVGKAYSDSTDKIINNTKCKYTKLVNINGYSKLFVVAKGLPATPSITAFFADDNNPALCDLDFSNSSQVVDAELYGYTLYTIDLSTLVDSNGNDVVATKVGFNVPIDATIMVGLR